MEASVSHFARSQPSHRADVLVVDDEVNIRTALETILHNAGYGVTAAEGPEAALRALEQQTFDLVITDLRMAGDDGFSVLKTVKGRYAQTQVIILTAYGTIQGAVQAIKEGAHDFIEKPIDRERFLIVVHRALEHRALYLENQRLRQRLSFRERHTVMLGHSPAMRSVYEKVEQVAPTDATVLIEGESGVGKELVARLIHENSPRKGGPLLAINCGSLPESLLESELFGHEKGAFTGAHVSRPGKLEMAHEGTIFLDEVSEMSPKTQVDFLRVLEEREIRRIGGDHLIRVEARFVAATNKALWDLTRSGKFREDLYYRLNVVPILIPPLRERRVDIPILAESFLKEFALLYGRPSLSLSEGAMKHLRDHPWPGNIRQLRNLVERLVVTARKNEIAENTVVQELSGAEKECPQVSLPLESRLEEVEKTFIRRVLSEITANREEAARVLGISSRALYYKLKRYGLLQGR